MFLDGASQPEELAEQAAQLGLEAAAITDHDGFYGVVRFAEAARALGVKTIFGAELSLDLPGPQRGQPDPLGRHLLALARGPEGYAKLSRVISEAHLAGGEKETCAESQWDDLCLVSLAPSRQTVSPLVQGRAEGDADAEMLPVHHRS
jgi:DNA polymerase III alpha subunit